MYIMGELSGNPVFMANPSLIDTETNEIILAHCVLPLDMPESYRLMTHFESGLGVAVKGELELGEYTLFKCWEDGRFFIQAAQLVENLNSMKLCRTQVKLKTSDTSMYLKNPLSNHQIICKGNNQELVEEFFNFVR